MAAAAAEEHVPVKICARDRDTVLTYADGREAVIPEMTPVRWLDHQCMLCGSSLEGRMASYRYLTKTLQKSAVLISECSKVLYFPLLSMKDPECIWLSFARILSFRSVSAHETEVLFDSGYRCIVPVNCRIIRGQMKRCEIFLEHLHQSIFSLETNPSADV